MSTIYANKDVETLCRALVNQYNALHDGYTLSTTQGAAYFHRDISGIAAGDYRFPTSTNLQVSYANGTDLPSTLKLAAGHDGYAVSIDGYISIQGALHYHFLDDSAHLYRDLSDTSDAYKGVGLDGYVIDNTSATTQLSSLILLLNAAKVLFNAHLTAQTDATETTVATNIHVVNDTTNSVATANATDLPSSEALAIALKTAINAHIISGPSVGRIKFTSP
jgi:hypothetical protein